MRRIIERTGWNRREYFEFFNRMDDPYYGVVVNADFTECYRMAKADGASFSLYSMHRILKAVNAIPEFHYRVEGDEIVHYDLIHSSPTVGRKDGSYGCGFMEYFPDRDTFVRSAKTEMERVQALTGLCIEGSTEHTDTIFFSAVPWLAFTEMKHPHFLGGNNGIPRISTGRLIPSDRRLMMPVSLDMHHGMADGYHAAQFYKLLEDPDF